MQRTVPFGLFCHSILIIWYALHGHADTDTDERRDRAPWYRSKAEPSTLDMLVKLRRQIIAARFLPTSPDQRRPKKSWKSSKPGLKPPHNRESRVAQSQLPVGRLDGGATATSYVRRMQTGQVSIWVPIIVGIIGLVGVVVGQLVNAWREDRRWRREQEREDLRWKREAEKEAAKRVHDSLIDWRDRRINTYGEYLESIHNLIKMSTRASWYNTSTIDTLESFKDEYQENENLYSDISQRVRLLASDEVIAIMKNNALTMQLPVPVMVRFPEFRLTPPTPEEARKETEAEIASIRKELEQHSKWASEYYHALTDQMRADLGAASLPRV